MRVVGPAPMGGDFLEIVMDEKPLRQAMLRFSLTILLLSLVISCITAMLVYIALDRMLVRPMRRITANMMRFRDDPENPARIIVASSRQDDAKTKRRLDTALSELRELRDALPPSERLRIERRKQALGPPGGNERRKGRPRGRPDQSP